MYTFNKIELFSFWEMKKSNIITKIAIVHEKFTLLNKFLLYIYYSYRKIIIAKLI